MTKFYFLLLCFFGELASAMEFSYSARFADDGSALAGTATQLTMSGPIVRGDAQRFREFIRRSPKDAWFALKRVSLESPGGEIEEAMKLAAILNAFYPRTWVAQDKKCASSCSLLWLAGSTRGFSNGGKVGIHRPTFSSEYQKSLSLKESQQQYENMSASFKSFVLKQGLPQSLYEKLMATSSAEVYWLTKNDWLLIGVWPPYYEEKLRNRCGPLPDAEKKSEYNRCENKLTLREKAQAFDRILESTNDSWWLRARESFLGVVETK